MVSKPNILNSYFPKLLENYITNDMSNLLFSQVLKKYNIGWSLDYSIAYCFKQTY